MFRYWLEKFDENYETYLISLGTPDFVVAMIIDYNDVYKISVPKNGVGLWRWQEETGNQIIIKLH